jgi:hypothetical protein
MLTDEFKKHIAPLIESQQETAFSDPIKTASEIESALSSGRFNKTVNVARHWMLSVTLTVSPSDDDSEYFWHCSVAYINRQSGKPLPTWAYTAKDTAVSTAVIREYLGDVGEPGGRGINFKTVKIARHGYKHLNEFEKEHVEEGLTCCKTPTRKRTKK